MEPWEGIDLTAAMAVPGALEKQGDQFKESLYTCEGGTYALRATREDLF